ncbi:MAG: hypothetical protein CMH52_08160 [Myxococcales bacterium]|nr:hypothetical protein [Myxococcales bacterium]
MNSKGLFRQFFFSIALLALIALPICSFLFGCGCRHLFAGGVHHCELLPVAVTPKHACPWCDLTPFSLVCVFTPTVLISTSFGAWVRIRIGSMAGYVSSAIACLVILLATGLLMGRLTGFEPTEDRFSLCGWVSE